jgi:hypothetical protein
VLGIRTKWLLGLGSCVSACLVGNLEVGPGDGDGSASGAGNDSVGAAGEEATHAAGNAGTSPGGSSQGGTTGGNRSSDGGEAPLEGGTGGDAALADGGEGAVSTPRCGDYSEGADASNDYFSPDNTNGSYEYAGGTFKEGFTVCGAIDTGHYDAARDVVDVDTFAVPFDAAGDYIATIELEKPDPTRRVEISFSAPTGVTSRSAVVETRGVASVNAWEKGSGRVSVRVKSDRALPAAVPYKIRLRRDDLSQRCASTTVGDADQSYAESLDGPSSAANDVVRVDFDDDVQTATALTTDAPEPSAIVIDAGDRSIITGSMANVHYGELYADGDMFEVKTGDATQLTLRLDWPGTNADMDALLFNRDEYWLAGGAYETSTMGPDVATFAVRPHTSYWLWIAAENDSSSLPRGYSLSICGETFVY